MFIPDKYYKVAPSAQLFTCPTCGAVLQKVSLECHTSWHKLLGAFMDSLASRSTRTNDG